MKEQLMKQAKKMEAFAEIVELLENNLKWYQTQDEDGNTIDSTDDWSVAHLEAYRETLKAVRKIVGL